ncbi:MAG: multidrug transporter [Anaerolineae bacterium]|nr:multidrug transporter [Anaerolineae bacterium]
MERPCQAVLPADDPAWQRYSVPLSSLVLTRDNPKDPGYYPLDLYYFPAGWAEHSTWHMLRVPSGATEKGYYNVPDSMSNLKLDEVDSEGRHRRDQDLTHFLTARTCVPIQSWVHVFNATIPMGVFSIGSRFEEALAASNWMQLRLLFRAIIEQKQLVSSSALVKVGRNCDIDPSAVILGPTTIGDNCKIYPGVVIDNCIIGDNVTISNNCHLMLSVVGHSCFLPFRAALFMTAMMENSIVAQNTCLQMCVIGRNSFVGAGTTFTDFKLIPSALRALDAFGKISDVGQPVLGGCIGHNVRVGSGMVIHPARTIESDVVLFATPERRVISRSVTFDMSDHHTLAESRLHQRLYPPRASVREKEMLEEW